MTWDDGHSATDIVCPMYPAVAEIVEWATTRDWRPLILCEFSHAMGNSNGCLGEYFDAFENTPGLQGGFIWEWLDHGIRRKGASKLGPEFPVRPVERDEFWVYGGDFGEEPPDANFVCDGLVWPARAPHPAMWELKKLAQPVGVALARGGVKITNKQDFESLAWLRGSWELSVEGKRVAGGKLPALSANAGEKQEVALSLEKNAGPGCFLTVRFVAARATAWCEAGHEVAWEQFAMAGKAKANPARGVGKVEVSEGNVRAGEWERRLRRQGSSR